VVVFCGMQGPVETSRKDSRHRSSSRYLSVMFSPVVSLRSLEVPVPEGQGVVFLSDVHLGLGSREADRERERRLVRLLGTFGSGVAHLFIVGDLFDYWFDYRRAIPRRHVRTLAALAELREGGLPITYLIGNHDFGHYSYFREELGIEVDAGDVEAMIGGLRFYISHGDGKAANDRGYLVLRSILRNPVALTVYRWLHPNIGIGLAARTSHESRTYTDQRDYGSDGLREFAAVQIAKGYDVVVMGHRHRAVEERIGTGLYLNLGDWLGQEATYAVFTPPGVPRLVKLPLAASR
jgi:UDP-2,3-diacylglucosamine hydrolase